MQLCMQVCMPVCMQWQVCMPLCMPVCTRAWYMARACSSSPRMNMQLPLLTSALALYRLCRIARSAYLTALVRSASWK